MAGPYTITPPVFGQPIPPVGFGVAVKNAIDDLHLRSATLETTAQAIIARGRRTTNTGNITTTEVGVLRIDDIPVQAGKIYRISTSGINMDASVAADVALARFRVAYAVGTGTDATIASTLLSQVRQAVDNITFSNIVPGQAFYIASANGYISVLLSCIRAAGTGNIVMSSTGTEYTEMTVEFGGADPGDTGTVI